MVIQQTTNVEKTKHYVNLVETQAKVKGSAATIRGFIGMLLVGCGIGGIGFMGFGSLFFFIPAVFLFNGVGPDSIKFQCPNCKTVLKTDNGVPSLKCNVCEDVIMIHWAQPR